MQKQKHIATAMAALWKWLQKYREWLFTFNYLHSQRVIFFFFFFTFFLLFQDQFADTEELHGFIQKHGGCSASQEFS